MAKFPCNNIEERDGDLYFAGQSVEKLAKQYGTPLYLMDEDRIRHNCRVYTEAFAKHFVKGSRPYFASKACCFKAIYPIIESEDMGADVVSLGELLTAKAAHFPMERVCFHGNSKTDEDITIALDLAVGCIVVDNAEELYVIDREAKKRGIKQKILLRLTPGIDPHTYAAVATGLVDSKFGSAIETGQAEELTKVALTLPHIDLHGFHCHVGSQVFAEDVFERAAVVMLTFCAEMQKKTGFVTREVDLGGGYGVRYVESDPSVDIASRIGEVAAVIHKTCKELGIAEPIIGMEPGRSIVADAGMTVYTVQTVKKIPGYKNYVAMDGGMADNPRFALYGSKYTCLPVKNLDKPLPFIAALVGRCCESGDMIQPDIAFPEGIKRGDLVATCTTGAYNFSMSSNYNRLYRPAVVMLKDGASRIVVRRQTAEDLLSLDE